MAVQIFLFSNNLPHNTKKALISPNKSQIEVGPKSPQGEESTNSTSPKVLLKQQNLVCVSH